MTPERWRRIEELYHTALEQPQEQRAAFLDEACGGDRELRREVESLLGYDQAKDSPLDHAPGPLADLLATETGSRLGAGAQLGPYRIEGFVGAGGMGEVYRATDTRLGRTVAIKLLRTRLTDRADGRQRFQREARAISSLSHPHICSLHDVGEHEGMDYLVMEYVEGETLEARLRKGKPPLKTALRYGMEIADAVAAAHARGIVHRDLKPGNVMITSGGVKLLDFGLAKVLREERPDELRAVTESLTKTGAVVGTPAYMAPEQIEGKECDARSDIFALGLMLYEMLTGRRAGLAAILKEEPPPIELRPPMPRLEDLIRACLARDPAERWQSAADVKRALGWVLEEKPAAPRSGLGRWWWAAGAAAALVVALALWVWVGFRQPEAELHPYRLTLTQPPALNLTIDPGPAVSPDGRQVAFVGDTAGITRLWIQALDSPSARELPGTEGGQYPFWAPDNRMIGFFANDQLKTIDVAGGPPRVICPAAPRGGAWNANGDILLTSSNRGPLIRVPASGGTPVPVTKLDNSADPDASHRLPQFLPDGRRFIYFYRTRTGTSAVYLGSLDRPNEAIRLVDTGYQARFVSGRGRWPDCLVWRRGSSLVAQPFDAERARLTGEAVSLAEDTSGSPLIGSANFSVSSEATLVYRTEEAGRYQLAWFSREGKRLGTLAQPDAWNLPRISPDGKRVALSRLRPSGGLDIWQIEIARGVPTQLTFGESNMSPVWSPDGWRIAYGGSRHLDYDVYQRSAGGGGEEERLTDAPGSRIPVDWSPDGRFLLVSAAVNAAGWFGDLGIVPLDGDRKPVALRWSPPQSRNTGGVFSPDGRWVAYYSDESGRFEVYVRSFPAGDFKLQVSTHGGQIPRWRKDGKELYYIAADGNLMAVPIRWSIKAPELGAENAILRTSNPSNPFDVTPDGQRFLMLEPAGDPEPAVLRVLLNWQAGLKR